MPKRPTDEIRFVAAHLMSRVTVAVDVAAVGHTALSAVTDFVIVLKVSALDETVIE
jgi:hypothetical protein